MKFAEVLPVKEVYYKRSRPGKSPVTNRGVGPPRMITSILIEKDPILKKHRAIERMMVRHEITELKLEAKGVSPDKAHRIARSQQPLPWRKMNCVQTWRKLKRMK